MQALISVCRRDHTTNIPFIVLYNRAGLQYYTRPEDEVVLLVEKKEEKRDKQDKEDDFLRELKEAEQLLEQQQKAREAADQELKELIAKQEQQTMTVFRLDSDIEHTQTRVKETAAKKSAALQRIEQQLALLQQQRSLLLR